MMNEKKKLRIWKIANEVRKHKTVVIFCFNTGSEEKETKLLDEKDINFQESVTQTPTWQNLCITNYDKFASNNGGTI